MLLASVKGKSGRDWNKLGENWAKLSCQRFQVEISTCYELIAFIALSYPSSDLVRLDSASDNFYWEACKML